MSDVDDLAIRIASAIRGASADEETCNLFNRFLSCRYTDSLQRIFRQGGQAFNAQREMRSAPVIDDSVNLIQDQRSRRAQHPPARFGSEQQIQRLWRRNEDMRWLFNQRLTLRGSRIASAHFGAHIDLAPISLAHERANSSKRLLKIFADIVAQSF